MQMLYKAPGPHFCDGSMVDYIVVPLDLVDDTVALGWSLTIPEALAAAEDAKAPAEEIPADDAPVTRAELEIKAKELGLTFDGRTSDAKLLAKIDEALKG